MRYEFEGDKRLFTAIYFIAFLIGLTLIIGGINSFVNTRSFLKNAVHTKARVVEITKVENVENMDSAAVFEFTADDGRPIRFKEELDKTNRKLGTEMAVIFERYDARNFSLPSSNFYASTFFCFGLAVPFLVVSIGYFSFLRFLRKLPR